LARKTGREWRRLGKSLPRERRGRGKGVTMIGAVEVGEKEVGTQPLRRGRGELWHS